MNVRNMTLQDGLQLSFRGIPTTPPHPYSFSRGEGVGALPNLAWAAAFMTSPACLVLPRATSSP